MSKIKEVKFHTNVKIGGSYYSYLTPEEFMSMKGVGPKCTATETEHGITIDLEHTQIKVGWTNIVYMVLQKQEEAPKASKTK